MKVNQKMLRILFTLLIIIGSIGGVGLKSPEETKAASGGILGQPAPDLDLVDWIDGDGKAMAPILLSGFKGKVIYLYFFQDW